MPEHGASPLFSHRLLTASNCRLLSAQPRTGAQVTNLTSACQSRRYDQNKSLINSRDESRCRVGQIDCRKVVKQTRSNVVCSLNKLSSARSCALLRSNHVRVKCFEEMLPCHIFYNTLVPVRSGLESARWTQHCCTRTQ